MKNIYFTPGPSQLFPTVEKHIHDALEKSIPSWSHRSEDFKSIFRNAADGVRKVMNAPKETHVFFLGSGTEAIERTVQNLVGEKSFHFVNGSFSKRLFKTASQLGKHPEKCDAPPGQPFDFSKASIPNETELLCFTQNETSMGIKTPMGDISDMKKKHPHLLVAVDVVSSAPCVDVDWNSVDCAFFSVQKCFGLPAGLGVIMANGKAVQKAKGLQEKGVSIGSFHSFLSMAEEEAKSQTPETPNVLSMYLLGKVCEDFQKMGIDTIKKETKEKANMLYDFFDSHPVHKPFVDDVEIRSDTVIVAKTPQGSKPIISRLKEKGLVIGAGYSDYKDTQIRIANFPAHSIKDMKHLLDEFSKIS